MKNYFLKNGTRESGPYMLDDLKYQRINPDTLVKEEGGSWQPVSQNRDLRFLLQMGEGSNSYSDSGGNMKKQQKNPGSDRPAPDEAKARMMVLVAIAVAFAVAGLAMSLFFMTN